MTFAGRLVGDGGRGLTFEVQIVGVPLLATESIHYSIAAPSIDGRGLVRKVEESRSQLDIYRRLQTGGGFLVEMQDDEAGTLRRLFSSRSYRVTHLAAAATKTATTLSLHSTADLPSSGVVYIGGESIAYSGKAANTLTGCTRGYLLSEAQRHRGGTEQGASVYAVPQSWLGRRVILRGYHTVDDVAGVAVPDLGAGLTLGTYRLEEAPKDMGDGRWELRCSHLSDELAKRKVGTGLVDADPRGAFLEPDDDGGVPLLKMIGPSGFARAFRQGAYKTHALVSVRADAVGVEASSIFPIYDATADSPVAGVDTVRLRAVPLTPAGRAIVDLTTYNATASATSGLMVAGRIEVDTIRHIAILWRGVPYVLALYAIASRLGDGENDATWDTLGGVEPTTLGGPGFRIGAGVPGAEIDVASLQALSDVVDPNWSTIIDEETPLPELLSDFCRSSNSAAVFSREGRLTFRRLLEDRSAVVATISSTNVKGKIETALLEDRLFARARLDCNYNPFTREHEATVDVIDEELAASYPNAEQQIVIQSRSIMVQPVTNEADTIRTELARAVEGLLPTLRRDMLTTQGGQLVVSVTCDLSLCLVELGDLVALSLPTVSDYRGGYLSGGRARVIARTPRWDAGEVDLDLLVLDKLVHWAPSVVVSSKATLTATTTELTLATDPQNPAGAITSCLAVGDMLDHYRPSTLTLYDHATNGYTVDSITNATTIVISHDASAEIPSTDDVLTLTSFGRGGVDAAGFSDDDLAVMVGTSGAEPYGPGSSRWR